MLFGIGNTQNQKPKRGRWQKIGLVAVLAGSMIGQGDFSFAQQQQQPAQKTAAQQKKVDTVAVVNRQPISRFRLGQLCVERFGKDVLQEIVNRMLLQQECNRLGIQITPADIDKELSRVAATFKISPKEYIKLIADRRGVPEQKLRNDITWSSLALRNIAWKSVQVSDAEVNQGIDEEFGRKVLLRMIVADDEAYAKAQLQAVRSNPESFGKIARDYSKDLYTAQYEGLARSPYKKGEMGADVDRVVFALKKDQISDIQKISGRFYIFKCEAIYPATKLTPEQRQRVFGIKRDQIREKKLAKAGKTIFRKLQDQAKIQVVHGNKTLAQQHPGVAALINGVPVKMIQLAEECIARSGEQVLKVEITRTILKQEVKRRGITITQSDLHAEIDRTAEEAGYVDVNGKVNREGWLSRITEKNPGLISSYIEDAVWPSVALRKMVQSEVKVTPEDMEKGFIANYGPRAKVLAIVMTDARSAETVWRKARQNPSEANFRELAKTYSAEMTSRYNSGEVPPVAKFSGRPELEKAAFSLKQNEISGIINEGQNWMILYGKGRTTPVVKNINDVKDIIYKRLMERNIVNAAQKKMEQLHANSEIDNFLTLSVQHSKQAMDTFKRNQNRQKAKR